MPSKDSIRISQRPVKARGHLRFRRWTNCGHQHVLFLGTAIPQAGNELTLQRGLISMVFIDVMAGGLVDPYIHLRINFILLNYRGVAFGALLLLSTLDELIDICIS